MGDRFLVLHVSVDLTVLAAFVVLEKLTHFLLLGNEGQSVLVRRGVHARFRAQVGHDLGIGEAVAACL